MLISCPNCKTTFALPAKYITDAPKKVKCSKCAHIWVQEPVNFGKEKLNELLKVDAPITANLPDFGRQRFKFVYAVTAAILLLMALSIAILKHPENHPFFANILGLPNYDGLRFHNFRVESEIVDKKVDFHLKGSIINLTDKPISLPVINVKAYSPGQRVMAHKKIKPPQDSIEPFATIDVAPNVTRISGNANRLELSFENWLEALLR